MSEYNEASKIAQGREQKFRLASKLLKISALIDGLDPEVLQEIIEETSPTGRRPEDSVHKIALKVQELRNLIEGFHPDEDLSR